MAVRLIARFIRAVRFSSCRKTRYPEMIKNATLPEGIEVNVIEFTKNKEHGRYGLLPDVVD